MNTKTIITRLVALNAQPKAMELIHEAMLAGMAAGCTIIQQLDCKSTGTLPEPTHEVEARITRLAKDNYGRLRGHSETLYRFQVSAGMIHNVSRFLSTYRTATHMELQGADTFPNRNPQGIAACVQALSDAYAASQNPKTARFNRVEVSFRQL